MDAVSGDPRLQRHEGLMKALTSQGASSDESESDTEPSVRRQRKPKAFRRIAPRWRSEDLRDFMWYLDECVDDDRKPPIGCRSRNGAQPRQRFFTNGVVKEDATARPGLNINCYDKTWLDSLSPKKYKDLYIIEEPYDFGLKKHGKKKGESTRTPGFTNFLLMSFIVKYSTMFSLRFPQSRFPNNSQSHPRPNG